MTPPNLTESERARLAAAIDPQEAARVAAKAALDAQEVQGDALLRETPGTRCLRVIDRALAELQAILEEGRTDTATKEGRQQ